MRAGLEGRQVAAAAVRKLEAGHATRGLPFALDDDSQRAAVRHRDVRHGGEFRRDLLVDRLQRLRRGLARSRALQPVAQFGQRTVFLAQQGENVGLRIGNKAADHAAPGIDRLHEIDRITGTNSETVHAFRVEGLGKPRSHVLGCRVDRHRA